MRKDEVRITVLREYAGRTDLDNVQISIPLIETYGEGKYADVIGYLIGREWFPNKSSYDATIGHENGPVAPRIEFQTVYGSQAIPKVELALKTAKRLLKRYEAASLIRPKTFGEAVALWSQVAKTKVEILRPGKNFGADAQMGEDSLTIADPRNAGEWIDRAVSKITKDKRTALGLDKPEVPADQDNGDGTFGVAPDQDVPGKVVG